MLSAVADLPAPTLLFEDISTGSWGHGPRRRAAATLRHLHEIGRDALSVELIDLLSATAPNRERVRSGVRETVARIDACNPNWRVREPSLAREVAELLARPDPLPPENEVRLIHGDYFASNLLAGPALVHVLDWDLAAFGDPAWDLAFLVGAEPSVESDEREKAFRAYGKLSPDAAERLQWHLRCWDAFWAVRTLL